MGKDELIQSEIRELSKNMRRNTIQIDEETLGQDQILTLTQQVKALKLSVACAEKYPSVY